MKVKMSKGFTLAEMLIVMAVVVVLAAAAIPAISGQVETAKKSIDIDTLRAAYSAAYTQAFMDANAGQLNESGYPIPIKLEETGTAFEGTAPKIGNAVVTLPANNSDPLNEMTTVTFTFKAIGTNEGDSTSEALVLNTAAISKATTSGGD